VLDGTVRTCKALAFTVRNIWFNRLNFTASCADGLAARNEAEANGQVEWTAYRDRINRKRQIGVDRD
jgi:inosose dehydratase